MIYASFILFHPILYFEYLDHIGLKCEVAARMWNEVFKWIDMQPIGFGSMLEMIMWMDSLTLTVMKKQVWKLSHSLLGG